MKLFVAGLPYDLDDAELEEIFEKFGTVASAKVAIDKKPEKAAHLVLLICLTAQKAQTLWRA